MLKNKSVYFIAALLIVVILYPKFPLVAVAGSFVAVRLEDFVLAAVGIIWAVWRLRSVKSLVKLPLHRTIILYLAIGAVAAFAGIFLTKTATLNQGLLHTFRRVEYFLTFFIAYDFLHTKEQLSFLTKTLLIISCSVALYGLGQQYFQFPIITTTNSEFSKGLALTLGPGTRINSTFAGHYDLAAFSVFPLLLCIGLLTLPIRHKWLIILIGLFVYWAMLLSASRVTFAALILTASGLVWVLNKKSWLLILGALAVIGIISVPQLAGRYRELIMNHLTFVQPVLAQEESKAVDLTIPDAMKPSAKPEDRSLNIRLQAEWPRALRSFEKNPLLGTGYSSIGLAVDNDYLRILAETGILGLAAFTLILLRFFKTSLAFLSKPKDISSVFVICISFGLISVLINALFIDVFEASKIAIILWLLLGMAEKTKHGLN